MQIRVSQIIGSLIRESQIVKSQCRVSQNQKVLYLNQRPAQYFFMLNAVLQDTVVPPNSRLIGFS